MIVNESELMTAVSAIKARKWCEGFESTYLNTVCAFPAIRRVVDAAVSKMIIRYELPPHQQRELQQIARAYVVFLILHRRCESSASLVHSLSRGLGWRIKEHYADQRPLNESLRSQARQYDDYVARAKRARVELCDRAIARLVGKSPEKIGELCRARAVYYMKSGLREQHATRVDGIYEQERVSRGQARPLEHGDFEDLRKNALFGGMARKEKRSNRRQRFER